ncbi:MAG: FIST N-terminal domain-containing protein [Thermoleophilaceae bacterium]
MNLNSTHSESAGRQRWFGVGHSSDPDPGTAGRAAALAALKGREAKLLIVFCSDSYDLQVLLDGVAEPAGKAKIVGCSTAGEIATAGPGDAGIVIVAIGGEGFSVATGLGTEASKRLREAGADAAACLGDVEERAHRVLLLLTDGLAGDQQEIVRGAYSVAGASVPLVGGCAGDDLKMKRTFQFFDRRVLEDSVVAVGLGSDAPFGIGVRHGWRTVGEPMLVTSSSNNRVYTLDDRPALDVYLDRLRASDDVRSDGAAFTAFALTHPLGLSRRSDEEHVRFVGEADFEDRSLGLIAEAPQGALAWLMEGDEESVLRATDAACEEALAGLGDALPLGLVAFDCIARRGVLGAEGISTEVRRVTELAGGAPVAGFYTYGEIARTQGMSGFHNQTLVVLALA